MIGILFELIISWVLLYLFERRSILALGYLPITKRLQQFLTGFVITAILCTIVQLLEANLKGNTWILNQDFTPEHLAKFFYWDLKSVIFEELIFRGAILYILLQRLKSIHALLISAAAFGVYHWFSMGIFGNLIPMIFIFTGTGIMGFAWALAFQKTRSIFLPIGLHLGWNFVLNSIFSKGPLGDGLFLLQKGQITNGWFSLIGLILVPILVLLIVEFFIKDESELEFH